MYNPNQAANDTKSFFMGLAILILAAACAYLYFFRKPETIVQTAPTPAPYESEYQHELRLYGHGIGGGHEYVNGREVVRDMPIPAPN